MRCVHILLFHRLNSDLNFMVETTFPEQYKQTKSIPCLNEFLLSASINMLLHPLHLAETRFILQNRRANFAIYKSSRDLLKNPGELARGLLLHVPRNFFLALTGMKVSDKISLTSYYGTAIVFNTLSYPFLTLQRRREASSAISGMLENTKTSIITQIKALGFRGLYAGYPV